MLHTRTEDVIDDTQEPCKATNPDPVTLPSPEVCVICLDRISEKAAALPCRHDQFDFPCLGTWIQEQRVCPLCKAEVNGIQYGFDNEHEGSKTFHLPPLKANITRGGGAQHRQSRGTTNRYSPYSHRPRVERRRRFNRQPSPEKDVALDFRRQVYDRSMYSLHVGTNRISRYRNVTPLSFQSNAALVTRAKVFIRRELAVFDFLNPTSSSFGSTDRRASNAEFLLEYIVSILKSIDLKASTGQAEELLKDFLGRSNARLFLHELQAWLRSPYERLTDWDRHVQYETMSARPTGGDSTG